MIKTEKEGPAKADIRNDKRNKLAVMEMFRQNGRNIVKTRRESGVNRQTLVKWINADETNVRKQYTNVAKKGVAEVVTDRHQSISDIAVTINEQIILGMENVSDNNTTIMYLLDLVLKRMMVLIDAERDINKLIKLLSVLSKNLDLEASNKPTYIPGAPSIESINANFNCNEEMLILFAERLTQYNDTHNEN